MDIEFASDIKVLEPWLGKDLAWGLVLVMLGVKPSVFLCWWASLLLSESTPEQGLRTGVSYSQDLYTQSHPALDIAKSVLSEDICHYFQMGLLESKIQIHARCGIARL